MYKYTQFQAEYAPASLEKKVHGQCPSDMKKYADQMIVYMEENKERLPFNNWQLIRDEYADEIAELYKDSSDYPSAETIREWFEDPIYDRMTQAPQTILWPEAWPTEMYLEFIKVFKNYFPVFEDFIKWKVNILLPGDAIALHHDPRWRSHVAAEKYPGREFKDMKCYIFLDDQLPGHVCYLGDEQICYKKYDMYTFPVETLLHGACNLGYEWRNLLIISYVEEV